MGDRAPGVARCWTRSFVLAACLATLVPQVLAGPPGAGAALRPAFVPLSVAPVGAADPGVVVTPGQDVPDPFVVRDSGLYYMFASQEQFFGANVPLMVSSSLTDWAGAQSFDAMPTLPPWAAPGFTWSPDVRHIDGRWVMFFNAALAGRGFGQTKCIGVATASDLAGPYTSSATAPLVCQLADLGSIDPRTFVDPTGRLWLLWKSDDNADVNGTTHSTIWVQQLSPDGLRLLGDPVALLTADQSWEGRIVEAPDMVFAAGRFWLFFSGNWFNQPAYSIGVADCASPIGPCFDSATGPWMASNAQGQGPGEESLFYDGARWWMFYAPFSANLASTNPRPAAIARLLFDAEGPVVVPPGNPLWAGGPPRTLVVHRSGRPVEVHPEPRSRCVARFMVDACR